MDKLSAISPMGFKTSIFQIAGQWNGSLLSRLIIMTMLWSSSVFVSSVHAEDDPYKWANYAWESGLNPQRIAMDGTGNIYFSNNSNHDIRKVTPAGVMTIFAGSTGMSGFVDGVAGRFKNPSGIAVDGNGNVYVADWGNNAIRKITPTGTVSTIAGNGSAGSADGIGAAARFDGPCGIAVDSVGNLYVVDSHNHTIRKITPAGVTTTVAGSPGILGYVEGTGSAARFNDPSDVAVDASGNLYIADSANNVIRKITPAGEVSTFAGSAASLSDPEGVAIDGNGNVYVADTYHHTVRKITQAGVITTLGGSSGVSGVTNGIGTAARFNSPIDVVYGTKDGNGTVYVTDLNNSTIRVGWQVFPVAVTGSATTVTTTSATLNGTVNPKGLVSTAKFEYGLTVAYGSTANITFTPNDGTTTLAVSKSITGLQTGTTYHYRLSLTSEAGTGVGNDATFATAVILTYDAEGGTVNPANKEVIPNTVYGALPTPARAGYTFAGWWTGDNGTGTLVTETTVVSALANHTIYAKWTANGYTVTYDVEGGAALDPATKSVTFNAVYETLATPTKTGYTFAGWWTGDNGTGTQVTETTVVSNAVNHTIYAKWTANSYILTYDAEGGAVTPASQSVLFGSAYGTLAIPTRAGYNFLGWWTGDNGTGAQVIETTIVGSVTDHTLYAKWTENLYTWTTLAGSAGVSGSADGTGSAARFYQPAGIAVDTNGYLYVADSSNSTVRKITPAGVVTTLAGNPFWTGSRNGTGSDANFLGPVGITVSGSGNLYVTDSWNHTIRKITQAGVVETNAGYPGISGSTDGYLDSRFYYPKGITIDGSGNLYVADTCNGTIRKITPSWVVSTIAGSPGLSGSVDGTGNAARFNGLGGITVDGSGNLYVTDEQIIRKITSAGVVTTLAGHPGGAGCIDGSGSVARFDHPSGIAVDGKGNLYVTDSWNHVIRKITSAGVVTTIAGSPGVSGSTDGNCNTVRFSGPLGIASGVDGNLYVVDQWSHTIRVGRPASIVVTGVTTGIAATTVTLNGTVNPKGTVTTAQFEYGLTTSYGTTVGVTLAPNNGSTAQAVNSTLTGLQSGTTYHYRLTANNNQGFGLGDDATFTTNPIVTYDAEGGIVAPANKMVTVGIAYGTLATPTRTGYTFAGWWTGDNGTGTQVTEATVVSNAANHTLYAKWTVNGYTVTYDVEGGVVLDPSTKSVIFDAAYGTLASPIKTGYTFVGWWTGDNGTGTQVTDATIVSNVADHTIYAKWTVNGYTVTYDTEGGALLNPATKSVIFNAAYGTLASPTRTGYTFAGWWTGDNGTGTEVTETTTVSNAANHTLYAKWTANTYTVAYEANGGTVNPSTKSVIFDAAYGTLAMPIKTGYSFAGWWTGDNGTGTEVTESTVVSIAVDHTLYAKWLANSYTMTYDAQSGVVTPSAKSVTFDVAYGTLAIPVRAGYTFVGWWTGPDGAGSQVTATTVVSNAANHTIYAKWLANSYTITYDAQSGIVSPSTKSVTFDAAYGALAIPTRAGYTFAGWWTGIGGAGSQVMATMIVTTASDHTLYAKWMANTYTLTYDAKGGTVIPSAKSVIFDSTYGALAIPARTGYTFSGWWTGDNGTGTQVTDTTVVSTAANHTIYAKWYNLAGTLVFSQSSYSVIENQPTITLTVIRTEGGAGSVTVQYATANGTAIAGTDYTAKAGTLTFAAGVTSQTIPIAILNKDAIFKNDRNFSVILLNPAGGAGLGTPATATVTVQDNDISALKFKATSYTVAENVTGGKMTVTISRAANTGPVSVKYSTVDGTAKAGTDYTVTSGTMSFTTETSKTFTVPILNNTIVDGSRRFSVVLSDPSVGAMLGTPSTVPVSITDDDKGGSIQFSATTASVKEDVGTINLTVTRSNGAASGVTVNYITADGTARVGSDYTATSGSLTFAANETSKTITVPINPDLVVEPNETFTMTLSNPGGGATLGTNKVSTVTITNDDAAGTLQVAATAVTVAENAGKVVISVNRTGGASGAVGVSYATANGTALAGTDYMAISGTLSFAESETSKTIEVPITDNTIVNTGKTFKVTLSAPTGGVILGTNKVTTVTISSDDVGGAIQFSPAAYTVNETDGTADLTIVRTGTGPLAGGVTVKVATVAETTSGKAISGSDYTPFSAILTFAAGETSKKISIPILNDTIVEANETFKVTLSTPTGGATVPTTAASAIVTIVSDDVGGTIQFSDAAYSVNEAAGTATITVIRTGGAASGVTVKYATVTGGTASSTSDYKSTSGTLTFGVGETSKTFTVPILNDTKVETSETVKLTLSSVAGGATLGTPATVILTIIDDDAAPVSLSMLPSPSFGRAPGEPDGAVDFSQDEYSDTGSDDDMLGVPVTVVRASGAGSLTVNYSIEAGSAIPGSDYAEVSGTLTFKEGETSKTFLVPVLKNPARKLPATVSLNLEDPATDSLISTATLWLFP